MYKKKVCVVLLCLLCVLPLCANQNFAVTIDPTPFIIGPYFGGFGAGLGFEVALPPFVSFHADGMYLGGNMEGTDAFFHWYKINADVRFYPTKSALSGFFVNAGASFLGITAQLDSGTGAGSEALFSVGAGLGYKIVFGKELAVGFFLEPIIGINYCFMKPDDLEPIVLNLLGMRGFFLGLKAGITF